MPEIGYLSLLVSFISSIYALIAFIIGIRTGSKKAIKAAKGGVAAACFGVAMASLILIYLLITSDFSVKYVYEYTTSDLPAFYKLSAFWAGNAGSLLLWALFLGIYTAVITFSRKFDDEQRIARVASILLVNLLFFLFATLALVNPFETLALPKAEGYGLNPMLQNPGMVFHPVTLYLGYVGFAVPFAFAMAALMMKSVDDSWIKLTRRWTVVAWLFLSLGNLYGAQWAYVELGWGGFWAWDPVENASFMPWLVGTAFLHSIMVQERKDMLKIWNVALIILTYWLSLFGTFLVRSGVISSVHAFQDTGLGTWFAIFMFAMLIWAIYLLVTRINLLGGGGQFDSFISKESSFLLNNLLLVGAAFAVFWGTIFPLVSELFSGVKMTVGINFFNTVAGPILLAMVFLMGFCPLVAWQKSTIKNIAENFAIPLVLALIFGGYLYYSGITKLWALAGFIIVFFVVVATLSEFIRGTRIRRSMTGEGFITALGQLMFKNRRRYGGYIVHIGIFMMTLGILGQSFYKQEVTKAVQVGQAIDIGGYHLTFNGLQQRNEGKNQIIYSNLAVTKNGQAVGVITPEKVFYPYWEQPRTEVAINGTPREDLYVILAGWDDSQHATFQVHVNPLIWWLWFGGYVLIAGTLFAVWPGKGSGIGPRYLTGLKIAK